jgi:ABC-type Zn uptake system ZnuABC Zn-binding protein ZnuA
MKRKILILALTILTLNAATGAEAKIRVVASTSDLASIAEMIAGDHAECEAIVTGKKDPHFVEVLPSYMVKVARADIYLQVGGDLDYWANQIIDGSQNGKLVIVDCSKNIEFMERPSTRVNASMGDIHRQGNPHYWLDPENGKIIALTITEALKQVDPTNAADYDAGLQRFTTEVDRRMEEWRRSANALHGLEIITYHNSWPYFCRAFGIRVVGFVEPKPGIEPTPSHTAKLISMCQTGNIRIIGKEPYFSDRTPKSIARQTDAKVVDLPPSVGGAKGASDYLSLFDTLLLILTQALEGQ